MAKSLNLINDLYSICAPTPLQHGVVAGFSLPRSFFDGLKDAYATKRTMICDALDACGMSPVVPQGAYYVLADISSFGYGTAKEAALALLAQTKVAAIPGSAFYRGETGETLLRFCFAADDGPLAEACKRIATFKS
jgi:aminotransferase